MRELPQIEIIPVQDAVSKEDTTVLDVLIRIIPPEVESATSRPDLNLALVIDRSGSMRGDKIEYARQAAIYAVEQLLPTDRIGVVVYDDKVETLLPSTPAVNKHHIINKIKRIRVGNSTALHAGWVQGGVVVSEALHAEALNRVLLLSDGLANVGETNTDVICTDVHGLAKHGVGTSTMGVGRDYNEDLMSAMARSGDGNYWYIQSPSQLQTILDQELQGLMLTIGKNVTLDIRTEMGVTLLKILNDLDIDKNGYFCLPNLISGNPIDIVARFKVACGAGEVPIFDLTLAWDDPEESVRYDLDSALALPSLAQKEVEKLIINEIVKEQVVLLEAAQAKQDAMDLVDRGEIGSAKKLLKSTKLGILAFSNAPGMAAEADAIDDLESRLDTDAITARKMALYQSHNQMRSRSFANIAYRMCRGPFKGDITKPLMAFGAPVEAIVNSADTQLSQHGAVSHAIHSAAGPELLQACLQLGGCAPGQAKITKGYNLPAEWVIHTVCPPWQDGHAHEEEYLRQCYMNSLQLAVANGIRSIAFPAIGVGAMGFPFKRAAEIGLQTVGNFLAQDRSMQAVLFVCYDDQTKRFFDIAFTELTGYQV